MPLLNYWTGAWKCPDGVHFHVSFQQSCAEGSQLNVWFWMPCTEFDKAQACVQSFDKSNVGKSILCRSGKWPVPVKCGIRARLVPGRGLACFEFYTAARASCSFNLLGKMGSARTICEACLMPVQSATLRLMGPQQRKRDVFLPYLQAPRR